MTELFLKYTARTIISINNYHKVFLDIRWSIPDPDVHEIGRMSVVYVKN